MDWRNYLAQFHRQRPGITEQVLRRARTAHGDAYEWLAAAVPAGMPVVDVACGNAPLWTVLAGRAYLGLDAGASELTAAHHRGVTRLAQADATALPLADASTPIITCSMGLHILTPLDRVLAEIGRVLRPGGRLIATIPASGPLRAADLPVITGLLTVLGRRLGYPNEKLLSHPATLHAAGLRVISDELRGYPYRLHRAADADLFLASLYLPGLPPWRWRAARIYLRSLARIRAGLPIPIRRIVATRR